MESKNYNDGDVHVNIMLMFNLTENNIVRNDVLYLITLEACGHMLANVVTNVRVSSFINLKDISVNLNIHGTVILI
jgi:hypothetical protein